MSAYLDLPDGQLVKIRDGLVLGRVAGCDVVVDDTKASRKHAKIHVQGPVVEIEDLGSSNGTTLNGKPVQRRVLRDGDEIGIGATVLVFREQAPQARGAGGGGGGAAADDDVDLFGGDDAPAAPPPARAQVPPAAAAPPPPPPPPPPAPAAVDSDDLFDDPIVTPRDEPPAPKAAPKPPAAAPKPPAPGKSLVEFADEVVSVRSSPQARGASSPTPSATGGIDIQQKQRSLQFHKQEARGGALGDDLSQLSGGMRALIYGAVLVGMVGVAWLLMNLVS
ncbi:MAG: FHA domain-containing protein [Planctomycetota bacterium]